MSTVFVMMRSCHEAGAAGRTMRHRGGASLVRVGPSVVDLKSARRDWPASRACCSGAVGQVERRRCRPTRAGSARCGRSASAGTDQRGAEGVLRRGFLSRTGRARPSSSLRGALRLVRQHRMARVAEQACCLPPQRVSGWRSCSDQRLRSDAQRISPTRRGSQPSARPRASRGHPCCSTIRALPSPGTITTSSAAGARAPSNGSRAGFRARSSPAAP